MTQTKVKHLQPIITFVALLGIGLLGITAVYRSASMRPPQPLLAEELTEREKQLITAEGDMSKWLIGLASAGLVAVVGLRIRNPREDSLVDLAPMSAYALLLLSLYGGFLAYATTFDILRHGPVSYFYGDGFRAPVLFQFWTLMGALCLLASWLFRKRKTALVLSVIAAVIFVNPVHSEGRDDEKCVKDWFGDRLHVSDTDVHDALSVLNHISRLEGAKPTTTGSKATTKCVDANSVMDSLRFAAVDAGKPDDVASFKVYLQSIDSELSHPDLAVSDVVHSILDLMQPWAPNTAVLSVRSSHGVCDILLNATRVGLTNWDARLAPGDYRIRVVKNGTVLYRQDALHLGADEQRLIDVDHLP